MHWLVSSPSWKHAILHALHSSSHSPVQSSKIAFSGQLEKQQDSRTALADNGTLIPKAHIPILQAWRL
ncbi:unnamed protein product [Calypogeia fissa]